MGDMADYYREQEYDEYMVNPFVTPNYDKIVKKGMWKQKNGKEIHISEMTTSHLINSIKMIDNYDWRLHWKETLMKELESR